MKSQVTVTRAIGDRKFKHLVARVTVTWGLLPLQSFLVCVNITITLNHNRITHLKSVRFVSGKKEKQMSYRLGRVLIGYQFRRMVWQIIKVILALAVISLCGWGCWLVSLLQPVPR